MTQFLFDFKILEKKKQSSKRFVKYILKKLVMGLFSLLSALLYNLLLFKISAQVAFQNYQNQPVYQSQNQSSEVIALRNNGEIVYRLEKDALSSYSVISKYNVSRIPAEFLGKYENNKTLQNKIILCKDYLIVNDFNSVTTYYIFNETSYHYIGFNRITNFTFYSLDYESITGRFYFKGYLSTNDSQIVGYIPEQHFPFPTFIHFSLVPNLGYFNRINGSVSSSGNYFAKELGSRVIQNYHNYHYSVFNDRYFRIFDTKFFIANFIFLPPQIMCQAYTWHSTLDILYIAGQVNDTLLEFYFINATTPYSILIFKYLTSINLESGWQFLSFNHIAESNELIVYYLHSVNASVCYLKALIVSEDGTVNTLQIQPTDCFEPKYYRVQSDNPKYSIATLSNWNQYYRYKPCPTGSYFHSVPLGCILCDKCCTKCSKTGCVKCPLNSAVTPLNTTNTTNTANTTSNATTNTTSNATTNTTSNTTSNFSNLTPNSSNTTSNTTIQPVIPIKNQTNTSDLEVDAQLQGQLQDFKAVLNSAMNNGAVSSSNKLPGGRRLVTPLMTFFVNFDDFWLYNYHERSYDSALQSMLDFVAQTQNQKWSILPFETILGFFGYQKENFQNFFSNKKGFTSQKFYQVQNNSNGFFPNTPNFLFSNIILTFVIFLIVKILYSFLRRFKFSKFLKEYSFWPSFLVMIFEGNLLYFSYILTFDLVNFYSFSFSYKILNVSIFVIAFCCFMFGGFLYLFIKITHPFQCQLIMGETKYTFVGIIYITLAFGFRSIIFGLTHFVFDKDYEKKIYCLIVLEVIFMLMHLTALNFGGRYSILKFKTKIWLCAVFPGFFRLIINANLIFTYSINNLGQFAYFTFFIQANMLVIYGYMFLFIMTAMTEIIKTIRELFEIVILKKQSKKRLILRESVKQETKTQDTISIFSRRRIGIFFIENKFENLRKVQESPRKIKWLISESDSEISVGQQINEINQRTEINIKSQRQIKIKCQTQRHFRIMTARTNLLNDKQKDIQLDSNCQEIVKEVSEIVQKELPENVENELPENIQNQVPESIQNEIPQHIKQEMQQLESIMQKDIDEMDMDFETSSIPVSDFDYD